MILSRDTDDAITNGGNYYYFGLNQFFSVIKVPGRFSYANSSIQPLPPYTNVNRKCQNLLMAKSG